MGAPNSKRSPLGGEAILLWIFITVVVLGVGSVTGAVHLGSMIAGDSQKLSANPFELVLASSRTRSPGRRLPQPF